MPTLNGADGPSRQGSAYAAFDWESGERPPWWFNASLMWEFNLQTGKRFATSNLEEAVVCLSEHLRRSQSVLRRTLFASIPLSTGQDALIDHDGVAVTAHQRLPYLRAQVEQLARLEALLTTFRPAVVGDVLAVFAAAYSDGGAATDRLLDREDPSFFLGVDLRTLDRWSREYNAYEVQEFVRQESEQAREERITEAARKRNARQAEPGHEALVRRYATQIMRFTGYFDASDFEPENQHETRALELHCAVKAAASADAEERATVERDRYLIQHVFKKR